MRKFSKAGREAMRLAEEEARRHSCSYLATHHVLFGIVKEGTSISAKILRRHGAAARNIQREFKMVGPSPKTSLELKRIPNSTQLTRVRLLANMKACQSGDEKICPSHILFAIMEVECKGLYILKNLVVSCEDIKEKIIKGIAQKKTNNKK